MFLRYLDFTKIYVVLSEISPSMRIDWNYMTLCLAISISIATALSGCSVLGNDPVCPLAGRFGITVTAIDSHSKGAINDFLVVAREGSYIDSAAALSQSEILDLPHRASLVPGREGTYSVSVSSTGYVSWKKDGIEVKEDKWGCSVETVELETELDPI